MRPVSSRKPIFSHNPKSRQLKVVSNQNNFASYLPSQLKPNQFVRSKSGIRLARSLPHNFQKLYNQKDMSMAQVQPKIIVKQQIPQTNRRQRIISRYDTLNSFKPHQKSLITQNSNFQTHRPVKQHTYQRNTNKEYYLMPQHIENSLDSYQQQVSQSPSPKQNQTKIKATKININIININPQINHFQPSNNYYPNQRQHFASPPGHRFKTFQKIPDYCLKTPSQMQLQQLTIRQRNKEERLLLNSRSQRGLGSTTFSKNSQMSSTSLRNKMQSPSKLIIRSKNKTMHDLSIKQSFCDYPPNHLSNTIYQL